jgi:hypothetical protein
MSDHFERVKALLPPPATVPAADWGPVHDLLGRRYPPSFIKFVETYGFGIMGSISFRHPSAGLPHWDLLTVVELYLGYLKQKQEAWGRDPGFGVPYPLHPEPGSLIPWAGSTGDILYFFRTDPAEDPESWPIVWHDQANYDRAWVEFPGPFDRFVYDLATGELPTEVVGGSYSYGLFEPSGPGITTRPDIGLDPSWVEPDEA